MNRENGGTAVARDVIVLGPSDAHDDAVRGASGAYEDEAGDALLACAVLGAGNSEVEGTVAQVCGVEATVRPRDYCCFIYDQAQRLNYPYSGRISHEPKYTTTIKLQIYIQ